MISLCRVWLRSLSLVLAPAVIGVFSAAAQPPAVTYTAVELATLAHPGASQAARALNDAEEVVGGGRSERGPRAFVLTQGPLQYVADLAGSDYSTAAGINAVGEVAGSANTAVAIRAFRSLRTGGTQDLGTLPGDSSSQAFGINNAGQVVGYSSGPTGIRAVVWPRQGAPQPLPGLPGSDTSKALAINDRGGVAGVSRNGSDLHAVFWSGGAVQDLGTLPGASFSEAVGLNNGGQVVGSSGDPLGARRAVLWDAGFASKDLGVLVGGDSSRALGINDRSEVVGTSESLLGSRAFVWTADAGMRDLNTLLAATGGFVLTEAVAVNNRGTILAIGRDDTGEGPGHGHDAHEFPIRVFLLIPLP
jgi:probable HAF family extracellular repeat protein